MSSSEQRKECADMLHQCFIDIDSKYGMNPSEVISLLFKFSKQNHINLKIYDTVEKYRDECYNRIDNDSRFTLDNSTFSNYLAMAMSAERSAYTRKLESYRVAFEKLEAEQNAEVFNSKFVGNDYIA